MRRKVTALLFVIIMLLEACAPAIDDPITLQNHASEDVTIPGNKPVLFFFITTYT
ncbi:hypothetical protein [Salinibacillus kushneri]|nr:hypothetical protein [Salinibacillus kushneri]